MAAPFSAIATAAGYLRTDGFERAVVLILEQAALPYPAVQPVSLPAAGSAVALVLERSDAMPVCSLVQRPAVGPERVGAVLAELTGAAPPESVLVLGPGLAGHLEQARRDGTPLARARLAPAGRLCTAVWWELADAWDAGTGDRGGRLRPGAGRPVRTHPGATGQRAARSDDMVTVSSVTRASAGAWTAWQIRSARVSGWTYVSGRYRRPCPSRSLRCIDVAVQAG